jgi:YkoY family integral membrane protein
MNIFQEFINTYQSFGDWEMWKEVFTSLDAWSKILSLVILEGLLSADNALVLAIMVSALPTAKMRKQALFYGIFGAVVFRLIAIGFGTTLMTMWYVTLAGALYLLWIGYKGLKHGDEDEEAKPKEGLVKVFGLFWGTVISVELMDIAFSVDSIIAAFGVSKEPWVLLIGGALGILMMRSVAKFFIQLIEKYPELGKTAYILILLISAKMVLGIIGFHINHYVFLGILVSAFLATFVIHNVKEKKHNSAA